MTRMRSLTAALGILLGGLVQAQQPFQTWLTYNHQARLARKWGYTFDLNHRTSGVFPFTSILSAARVGAIYHVGPALRITAGYAWFGTNVSGRDQLLLHENRLYYQGQYNHGSGKVNINHRIRIEHRWRQQFVSSDPDITIRTRTDRYRYLIQFDGPLTRDPSARILWRWKAINEIFLHTNASEDFALFDQNRTLAGVSLGPNGGNMHLAVLYQLIAQQQPLSREMLVIHSVRLTLFHNLDLRKRKPEPMPDHEPAVE
jgi:hypothetical protein